MLLVMGDFSDKIGFDENEGLVGKHGLVKTGDRGAVLRE